MVVVKIQGGLGNQMFQYATGYALSQRLNCPLYLHTPKLNKPFERPFALDQFKIVTDILSPNDFNRLKYGLSLNDGSYILRLVKKLNISFNSSFVTLNDKEVFDLDSLKDKSIYLDGYWQDQNLFKNFRDKLLALFEGNRPLPSIHQAKIRSIQSVSLHVRRGDYVTSIEANKYHGIVDLDFYAKAIDFIKQQHKDVQFYVFSDDLKYCKSAFESFKDFIFIESIEGLTDLEELKLMSCCNHNIIANSTFSWWAAWLNNSKTKTVIAPKQWFANETDNLNSKIIPETWIQF